ncbi:MAG: ubiquinone biosynthesis protein UbiB [Planctomycetes bacterium]|nr:ubiquinone biosynthesis protein UbiB [Planctomycetota bacterium]
MWETLSAARDLGRLHAIASVLVRYGFSDLVRRLGMSRVLEKAGRALRWKRLERMARLTPAQRTCQALEELGPTFVKLGQLLATRVDMLSPEWIEAFETLQDRVPFVPFDTLRPRIEEELGTPPDAVFARLDAEPVAAASLAQVHRAWLADGTPVAVKIRRPGVTQTIAADLRLLERLAEIAETELPEFRRFRPRELMRQFGRAMRKELDFSQECRHAERVARTFREVPYFKVPRVYWQWTTPRLNVQEFVEGIAGRDLARAKQSGLDPKVLAERGARIVLKMIFEDGFFHADPHPGNLFYLPDNRIALIDFGMVGRLTETRRQEVVRLLTALVDRDALGAVDVLADWSGERPVETESLAAEIDEFIDDYHDLALGQIDLGAMLSDMMRVVREHGVALPHGLALLIRALISLDGVGRRLDPEFSVVEAARPFLRRTMRERYRPEAIVRRARHNLAETVDLLIGLPRDVRRLVKAARRGAIQLKLDLGRLDQFGKQLDRAASRLTVGLVTAAIIIGTAIVMTMASGLTLYGIPLLGYLGFLTALLAGAWLLVSIYRSGRG